ncbi:hypothetical protein B0A54_18005 [Friedmanniomyces endolithicus]|uniref:Uncharacterized protein n=1 Tax=Friedmanniomyces endolithicus TaxID=329885 RepID=A0A4U0TNF6_9PEZI|nr:hypothetical protein B0A54_18005 [Friedmanniomyces endolithicus]
MPQTLPSYAAPKEVERVTLNCFLENCLLADVCTGKLRQPLAGLVFHFDIDSSGTVAETASLCSRGIKVNILVSNSDFEAAQRNYRAATDNSENLTVEKFLLPPSELSIERMHKLMAFSERSDAVPLYMEVIQRILRQMAVSGQGRGFNYGEFLQLLDQAGLSTEQQRPMRLRLDLLHSFMRWPPSKTDLKRKTARKLLDLQPGTLTVVDLSDPFVDTATVCTLFDICLSVAKEKRPGCGMVVALDEAHKCIDQSPAATNFTDQTAHHHTRAETHRNPGHHFHAGADNLGEAARSVLDQHCASVQVSGMVPEQA